MSDDVPTPGHRVAVVTGANHGIGATTAVALATSGVDVVVTYFRLRRAADAGTSGRYGVERARGAVQVLAEIEQTGGRAAAIEADLLDHASPRRLRRGRARARSGLDPREQRQRLGGRHVRTPPNDRLGRELAPLSSTTVDGNLGVDARAAALLIAELARRHIARSRGSHRRPDVGRVGRLPAGGLVRGCQAALEHDTMPAASELAPFGVMANVVHPPVTDIGWVTEEVRAMVADSADHRHVAEASEVAEVICWLRNDAARLFTGSLIRLRSRCADQMVGHRRYARRCVRHDGAVTAAPRGLDAPSRRLLRLRHELDDDGIRLPVDDDLCGVLLSELDYARHPHAHEGIAPRYGALVGTPDSMRTRADERLELVDITAVPLNTIRRLADGRSSFVARVVGGPDRLVCFDRTREYESSAVHLATTTGAFVVQRLGQGWVRLSTPDIVAVWDGISWTTKPLSSHLLARVSPYAPNADPVVLANLLDLCTHWLAAGRVGATLVWRLDGDPHELDGIGMLVAVPIPALDIRRRSHFAPLLNALSQYDRAALVDPSGVVRTVGVHLRSTDRSRREILPLRGTRHTSALRFTADQRAAVVFVVSSNGSLSVFRDGERLPTD